MINKQLVEPNSILVVGGSNNIQKPGGSALYNILQGTFSGKIYVVNPKEDIVQGVKSFRSINDVPQVDLAIIAISSEHCLHTIETLTQKKKVKAFIIYSAGFSEETEEGKLLEKKIVDVVNSANASLIGPNCIGIMNSFHQSLFTRPIPETYQYGADLISSSGGTATYIIESSMRVGLRFCSVWSVGNAAQIGVEDILEYLDLSFNSEKSSKIKLLYIESIKDPDRFLKHASSLIRKGCNIAAIKSGTTESGSRAASSHTGAIANPDLAVEALFRKAGIIRCFSREELATIGAVLSQKKLNGKNLVVISHAGGPAVILTDALLKGQINVPQISEDLSSELKQLLLPGSSTTNPIDILGTGTGKHLEIAIDFCIQKLSNIDAIAVIYGSPGVNKIYEAYDVLHKKIQSCPLPIYPILPSVVTASLETSDFVKKGHVNFTDEVVLANALSKIVTCNPPSVIETENWDIDIVTIRQIIENAKDGYQDPTIIKQLFEIAKIPFIQECISNDKDEIINFAHKIGFPVVLKCVGPIHKTDIGGVVLNVKSDEHLLLEFARLMSLTGVHAVLVQPMIKGTELFVGAKYESRFGHIVLCGLGGIFVEVLHDVASGLAPLSFNEASSMIRSLKGYSIVKGTRGQPGVNETAFAEIIVRLSILLRHATEIKELDINPLIASNNNIVAVDARIRIEKNNWRELQVYKILE